jgi:hypothetical protein
VLDAFIPHLVTSSVIHKDVDTARSITETAQRAQYNRQLYEAEQKYSKVFTV